MVLVLFLLCLINSFTDLNMIWAGTHAEWRGERLLFLVQPRSAWLFIANAIKEIPFYIYCDRYFLITDFQSRDSFCFYFNHNWCGYNYWDIVTTFYTIMYVDKIGVIRLSLFFFPTVSIFVPTVLFRPIHKNMFLTENQIRNLFDQVNSFLVVINRTAHIVCIGCFYCLPVKTFPRLVVCNGKGGVRGRNSPFIIADSYRTKRRFSLKNSRGMNSFL